VLSDGNSPGRSTGTPSSSARPQFERRSLRAGGRPVGADDGVPLPPEPPDEDVPPDEDEAALLAEIDAGEAGETGEATATTGPGTDPEAAAIALLTTQLGARAIRGTP
jgi:DNA polymerase III subunit gamma/tau